VTRTLGRKNLWALFGLNFFMADMQSGLGQFLGVFLLAHGWESGMIGTVLTIGGMAGMLATAPVGALVDASRHKRLMVSVAGTCTVAASALILVSQNFWVVAASQVATTAASVAVGPAVMGITLGLVHQSGFNSQMGRNQAFNHAGNVLGAALSGWLGWAYGFVAVFLLAALFGVISIACVLMIPERAIDHAAARGMKDDNDAGEVSGLRVLLQCRPLLILGLSLFAFHLGNAAMLPLFGLAVVEARHANAASFVAMTIVIAQAVMIPASLVAMRIAQTRGYWLVLLLSFLALPIRGLIASQSIAFWGVYPVQILDGLGAGLQSVAIPGLVARLLDGTGRVNVGQGAVMTALNVGAGLSPALGGWIAQDFGFPAAFLTLGGFALVSVLLWIANRGALSAARRGKE
jgi:predicted MFS family arabinose efflux permease